MKEFGKNLLKGVQIGLGICVSLVLVWGGVSFAAAAWGALPNAGTTLSSAAWNDIVSQVNAIAGAVGVSGNQVKLAWGNPGAGKILTSDASWVASWKSGMSQTTLWTSIPIDQIISGSCYAAGSTLTVTTPGFYAIQLRADAYLYTGNYNNLSVSFANAANTATYCVGTASLIAGATAGYMAPGAFCIDHLDVGTYNLIVSWSNASACPTSSIDKIFSGTAKLRLLNAD